MNLDNLGQEIDDADFVYVFIRPSESTKRSEELSIDKDIAKGLLKAPNIISSIAIFNGDLYLEVSTEEMLNLLSRLLESQTK